MGDWISDVLLFSAGIAGGILITMIVSFFRVDKGRRPDLAVTRARVHADIKERHDQEILHQAFRTTEDIQGELDKSLQQLRKTVTVALEPTPEKPIEQHPHVVNKK